MEDLHVTIKNVLTSMPEELKDLKTKVIINAVLIWLQKNDKLTPKQCSEMIDEIINL